MENELKTINKELKGFINEARGISAKCRKKLIKLIEKHFYVSLPKEDYKILDISIMENSNIIMRDIEYKTQKELSNKEELLERYNLFKSEVEQLLDTNATNFDDLKNKNGINNLLVVTLILSLSLVILTYVINQLLIGNYDRLIFLAFLIAYYGIPVSGSKFRERLRSAKKYIESLINK